MHAREMDLNLLIPLEALLDERHVSRAAARVHLTQSAMSRALGRLRRALNDELLIRTENSYELTPRARVIKRELEYLIPRIEALGRPPFDPATATDRVRVSCTDYVTTILGGRLFDAVFSQAPNLSLTIEPLAPTTVADVEHGRTDLAFIPFRPIAALSWQALFEEDFVCVLAADHPLQGAMTLADLARYPQAGARVLNEEAMILDRRLTEFGIRPPSILSVPYFTAVTAALPGSTFIATLPRRLTTRDATDTGLRLCEAPAELAPFTYGLTWHPRLDHDPLQVWFRGVVADVCLDI